MTRYRKLLDKEGRDRIQRLCAILEAIQQHGSLNRATAALGISYRQAWGLLRRVEDHLGSPLLVTRVGGSGGGGATLTDTAEDLLKRFRVAKSSVEQILSLEGDAVPAQSLLVASTIVPVEVGLLAELEAAFHRYSGLWVRHIAAGSGQALDIAREGRADLVLAHAPTQEAQFIQEGFGLTRHPVMTNDFLICGPPEDPAGTAQASSAADAFSRIAASQAPFLSRGDRSGTHHKEEEIWASAGISSKGGWYNEFRRGALGSGVTLREADLTGAYVLVDQAIFRAVNPSNLVVLFSADARLQNVYSLISLNPDRLPNANHYGANRFVEWAVGPEGQALIAASGYFYPYSFQSARNLPS